MKYRLLVLRWLVFLLFVCELAFVLIPKTGGFVNYRGNNPLSPILSFANFDGRHYIDIADNGYTGRYNEAFFPLYPSTIRALSYITHNSYISGLIVSFVCFLLCLKILYKETQTLFGKETATSTVLLLLSFPTAFFFVSVYTESIFLLLALLVFKHARKKQWLAASIACLLAGLTRVNGAGLVIVLLLMFVFDLRNNKSLQAVLSGWPLMIAPLGILSYMNYLYTKFGDPLYFLSVQKYFGASRSSDKLIFLHQVFYRYFKMMIFVDHKSFTFYTVLLEFSVTILFLVLLWFVYKKTNIYMLIYSLFVFVLPTLTGTLSSMPRYVLVMFPCFMVGGHLVSKLKSTQKTFLYGFFILLQAFTMMLFVRGYFVS